jgi:small multidrug resistance family-3 protein
MINFWWFLLAAVFEIAGCYGFWLWLRLDKAWFWTVPGIISLILFAVCLTRIEAAFAGRAYAAYGGIYIIASLGWLSWIERARPLVTDYIGVVVCLIGASILLFGARFTSG